MMKRRHTPSESGSVLVEAAYAFLVLAVLCFGAIEGAILLEHKNDLSDAGRAATRAGVITLPAPTDDYYILQSITNDRSLMQQGTITRVIIFKADSANGAPIHACSLRSITGICNRYTAADLTATKATIDAKQTPWPPSDRGGSPSTSSYLGVQITASHSSLTGLIPWPIVLTDRVVMRTEPEDSASNEPAYNATPNPNFVTTMTAMLQCSTCSDSPPPPPSDS